MTPPAAAPTLTERYFSDAAETARALAIDVGAALRTALDERGQASLIVSGGKSPVPFFHALRAQALDWSRVWIALADERWVARDAPGSNERLLREQLLVETASAARYVSLKSDFPTPRAGLAASKVALAVIPRPFDVVVLGMGEDGHTASLFPGVAGLEAALDPDGTATLAAIEAPVAPQARITLTLAALLDARRIFLALSGELKLAVYRSARDRDNPLRWPIAALLHQTRTPIEVCIS